MALTDVQEIEQRKLDRDQLAANETARAAAQKAIIDAQSAAAAVESSKTRRMEVLRMSESLLVEASRSKPVGERAVAAADVVAYAQTLLDFANGE